MRKTSSVMKWLLVFAVSSVGVAHAADAAAPLSPKAQLAADNKAAAARYESDKKLCADETSSVARLQCRRDAKAEYDDALTEAKARMAVASQANGTASTALPAKAPPAPACMDCGKVIAVAVTEKAGEGGPLGMIAGGAAGALLGHQIGGGTGKDLATIAGAVGGAYAGKKIEERAKTHTVWSVSVQFEDGSKRSYEFAQEPGYRVGDAVKKSGETITR
ncbi:MAG: glycine zipper 2TM domain-containing protein [Rhodoferax sp.]|nr:glycine zipper 2TM domain-containing protein [Rhodoferax sp.]